MLTHGSVLLNKGAHSNPVWTATDGFDSIGHLESAVAVEPGCLPIGRQLHRTVDLFTVAAMAVLVHADAAVVAADLAAIRLMQEERRLFCVRATPPAHEQEQGRFRPPRRRAVHVSATIDYR